MNAINRYIEGSSKSAIVGFKSDNFVVKCLKCKMLYNPEQYKIHLDCPDDVPIENDYDGIRL